jgi:hypothetical protein
VLRFLGLWARGSAGLTRLTRGNEARLLRPKALDALLAEKYLKAKKKDGLLGSRNKKCVFKWSLRGLRLEASLSSMLRPFV